MAAVFGVVPVVRCPTRPMVKLDIFSDPICPWCYIGKAGLDRALQANPDHPFEIEWHPFQLNPDMPQGGIANADYLEMIFGSKEAVVKACANVVEKAEAVGLTVNFADLKRVPNTLNAHRLIHWAGLEGRQTAAVSSLFRANFVEGQDIGEEEVLVGIAEKIEMDPDMVRRLLNTDADIEDIRARDTNAREKGISGVPAFIVDNHYVVSGAQPPELWNDVIKEIATQQSTEADT